MILRYRDWDAEKKLEKSMTVAEFIKEIILTDENKELKYYKISIEGSIEGKSNLVIYWQDNKIKSHHSTGIEFDYKEILNKKIYSYYSERIITVQDIISMDLDFKLKKKYNELKNDEVYEEIKKLKKDWEQEELERHIIKKVFKDSASKDDLIIYIKHLVENQQKQYLKISELQQQIDRCRQKEDKLQQQIKWLEYRLNNKI